MFRNFARSSVSACMIGFGLLAPSTANAVYINFIERGEIDSVAIDTDLTQLSYSAAAEHAEFVGTFTLANARSMSGSANAWLLEDATTRRVSDVVHVAWAFTAPGAGSDLSTDILTVTATFDSDTEDGSAGGVTGGFLSTGLPGLLEDGTLQLLTFDAPLPGGLEIRAQSDAPETTVPEPSALAVFATGLAGIWWGSRRKPRPLNA